MRHPETRQTSWLGIGGLALAAALLVLAAPVAEAKEKRSPAQTRSSSASGSSSGGSQASSTPDSGRSPSASPPSRSAQPRTPSAQPPRQTRNPRRGGSSRGHDHSYYGHGGHRYGYGYGYGYYPYSYYSYYYPSYFGYWGRYWAPWSTAVYIGGGGGGRDYHYRGRGRSGGLDLDIRPEEAEIWVDGEYAGRADEFDGFPTYLWLPEGGYHISFYHPGYQTISREYSVRGGAVQRLNDRMAPGEATHPSELDAFRDHPATWREDRLQRNRERRESVERRHRESDWRERRERVDRTEAESAPDVADPESAVGRLHLTVYPADASVYLDGVFLGTGRELAALSSGLVVTPGEHRLELVRPGFEAVEETFDLAGGDALKLALELEAD